jgi:predicted MFS family arabinose efflux permease
MSYELIAYYLSSNGIVSEQMVPLFLAFATGSGVIASLALGRAYDRLGLPAVIAGVVLSSLFAPIVFQGSFVAALIAMPLWGIGYATQDTLLKALIASVLPEGRRNLAFGLFYIGYGLGWLFGSIAVGLLYENSRVALVIFVVVAQLCSLPGFIVASRWRKRAT